MWNLKYGTCEPIYETECVCDAWMVGAGQVKRAGKEGFLQPCSPSLGSGCHVLALCHVLATSGEVEVYLDPPLPTRRKIIFLQPEMDIETTPHLLLFQGSLQHL